MPILLSTICEAADVQLVRDGEFRTLGFLSNPQDGMLVFVESSRYFSKLQRTPEVACAITKIELADVFPFAGGCATSDSPRRAFHVIHRHLAANAFYWEDFNTEIHPTACVHQRAFVAERNVRIGAHTRIEANATVLERSSIGSEAVIRSGAVIGSVGFQSVPCGESIEEMTHAGGVRLGDRVQVMANAVIATGVFHEFTDIGPDVRIGNCAFVSHNVRIGRRSIIGHGAIVNGNIDIGEDVWIGPNASLVNGIRIGDRAHVALGSVVICSLESDQWVAGNFAIRHRALLKHVASIR